MLVFPPLSLYIHIPWCIKKCPYCDFNSHASNGPLPEKAYIEALLVDFDAAWADACHRPVKSVFIGGGTPSLFSPRSIHDLLEQLNRRVSFSRDTEITLEANPGTFEQKKFSGFRAAGVNRLSIGIQSFNDTHLESLGRIHGKEEAINAVSIARNSGFTNINLDLMHGLPGQTTDMAINDLFMAINNEPEHISWYQLTIEPNTVFYAKPPHIPAEDALWEIQEKGSDVLRNAGFHQYEISAWSQPDKESRHNINYWSFGDFIGIGAGAHSKITSPEQKKIKRCWKTRMPKNYLENKEKVAGEKLLTPDERPLEFFMNALRLKEGVFTDTFPLYTGVSMTAISSAITHLRDNGFMTYDTNRLRPTEQGQRFLNSLLEKFMPE